MLSQVASLTCFLKKQDKKKGVMVNLYKKFTNTKKIKQYIFSLLLVLPRRVTSQRYRLLKANKNEYIEFYMSK